MFKKFFMTFAAAAVVVALACGCSGDDPAPADVPAESEPVGEEWIDMTFAAKLQEAGLIEDIDSLTPSMVKGITKISLNEAELTSVRGIRYFENLDTLDLLRNKLTDIDVSGMKKLKYINLGYMRSLTSVNLNGCQALEDFECEYSSVNELDVTGCGSIETLAVSDNELETLDLSGMPRLKVLYCIHNYLTTLDLSNCPELEQFVGFGCEFRMLDISNNRNLTLFFCSLNPGLNGRFIVKAWFDNEAMPSDGSFTSGSWLYHDAEVVAIDYVDVINGK